MPYISAFYDLRIQSLDQLLTELELSLEVLRQTKSAALESQDPRVAEHFGKIVAPIGLYLRHVEAVLRTGRRLAAESGGLHHRGRLIRLTGAGKKLNGKRHL